MNIYVGNLPHELTEEELRQAFETFGEVTSAKIITDRSSGTPRGFGFVEMATKAEAEAAIAGLNFPDAYYADLQAEYTRKRDVFLGGLDAAGLSYSRPQGAYYVMVDIGEFGAADDVKFCERLARKVGVAAVAARGSPAASSTIASHGLTGWRTSPSGGGGRNRSSG